MQISTSYSYAVHSDFLLRVKHSVEFNVGLAKGISSMTVGVRSLFNVGVDGSLCGHQ